MPEPILIPLAGLTDESQSQNMGMWEGTLNLFPDRENYLVNYPGRTDWFNRFDGQEQPSYVGTPPAKAPITRVAVFRDPYGKEHITFVQGGELRETYGNGFRTLYTFIGRKYDGLYYPDLFIHQSKLIIVNFGDPVLVWDGLETPHQLGVSEVPQAPELRSTMAPGSKGSGTAGFGAHEGYWRWANLWWPQQRPQSSPSSQDDADGTQIEGHYDGAVQFVDKYGNKGPISPPSATCKVAPKETVTPATGNAFEVAWYLTYDWMPPTADPHIVGVYVGRTANLEPSDPQGGSSANGIFYIDRYYDGVTLSRHTSTLSDTILIQNGLMDQTVGPPPQASNGMSFNRRIWLWGLEDTHEVAFSDIELFGQFRATNRHRAPDHVRACVPLGDRTVVITRSSVEVLYETENGIAILEQDFAHGAENGRSFVDVGGAVFGLWSQGFGFYDGRDFKFVDAPYYVQSLYLDDNHFVSTAFAWEEWYLVSIRKDMETSENNRILMFHIPTERWFIISESVYDVAFWRNAWIGCDDSLYELFKGSPAKSVLKVRGLVPNGASVINKRSLSEIRLLMEPSSNSNVEVAVRGEYTENKAEQKRGILLPSRTASNRHSTPIPYWGKVGLKYSDSPGWSVPGDVWITPVLNRPVAGFSHEITLTFPKDHLVRIRAIAVTFSEEERTEY